MSKSTDQIIQELVQDLNWYHPDCTRHVAESLLMRNGEEGSYLIRKSSLPGELAISIRSKDSVKHFNVVWNGSHFVFGLATFSNREEFLSHFENQPTIAGESGITTQLTHPYPRTVPEPAIYEVIRLHGEYGKTSTTMPKALTINSKAGFLTKLGGIVKNWKLRWFVLQHNQLSYFKSKNDKEPLRKLDLTECKKCYKNINIGKEFCFSLEFSWRTFYFVSETQGDFEEWLAIIDWKIKNVNKSRTLPETIIS